MSSPMVYAFEAAAIDDYLKDFGNQQNSLKSGDGFHPNTNISSVEQNAINSNATIKKAVKNSQSASAIPQNLVQSKTQVLLLGVFVNDKETDTLQVLQDGEQYFLPINSLTALTGVQLKKTQSNSKQQANHHYLVTTPLGNTTLSPVELKKYQNQLFIELKMLKKMGITANFNQADLAVYLFMGWDVKPNESKKKHHSSKNDDIDKKVIDYYPSPAGLLSTYFDSNYSQRRIDKKVYQQQNSRVGGVGYLMGGVWGINAESSESLSNFSNVTEITDEVPKQRRNNSKVAKDLVESTITEMELNNLYWVKSENRVAGRIGTNTSGIANNHSDEYTGASLVYSNRDINRHLTTMNADTKRLLKSSYQDYQHITGMGIAGGVAELRINGRAVARVQIALDGEYEFRNLDVSRLDLSDSLIEVAIYEYRQAVQPKEVHRINLGKRRSNVATDELLLAAGTGVLGNAFTKKNKTDADNHLIANAYAEYGISNNLSVRAGGSYQNDTMAWMAGLNYVPNFSSLFSPYSNLDLSYWHEDDERDWQAEWEYSRDKWHANYQYSDHKYLNNDLSESNSGSTKALNQPHKTDKNWQSEKRHSVTVNYRPNDEMSFSANHNQASFSNRSSEKDSRLFASVELNDYLTVGGTLHKYWDNREDDRYTYRVFYHDDVTANGNDSTIGLQGDNDKDSLSIQHRLTEKTRMGQSIAKWHDISQLHYLGYINHEFSANNRFNLGYSLFDGQLGWNTYWQYYLPNNGLTLNVGYQHKYVSDLPNDGYIETSVDDVDYNQRQLWQNDDYFYAQVRLNGWKSPKRGLQLGKYPAQKNGSIVVEVMHPKEPKIDSKQIRFNIDRFNSDKQKVNATLLHSDDTHSQYIINDIKAGEYRLSMDAKNLPFEYSTIELPTPKIKVVNHAPTIVPFSLNKYYAMSGRLESKQGNEQLKNDLADIVVSISKEGKLLQKVKTNRFGYFQILGLQAGRYQISAVGYQMKQLKLTDDHLLNIRLYPQ